DFGRRGLHAKVRERVGRRGQDGELRVHRRADLRLVQEDEREIEAAQLVRAGPHAVEQQRRRELSLLQHGGERVQLLQRLESQEQGDQEYERDGDEASA